MDILYIIFEISVKLPFLWACKNIQVFILKIDLILYRNTLKCTQTPAQRTVFLATKKATVNKINYLYILSSPLENKFYTYYKNDLKTFHIIKQRVDFSIELSAEIKI